MRKQIFCVLGAVLFLFFMATTVLAADKLGYVDLSRIFSEYGKTKEYDKSLSGKQGAYEAEREKKVNEIKQFQDKINLLSDKEKENKRPEMENKIKALQEFDRQKQTDLRKEQDEKMKEILKDIEDTVKQFAEKEGYILIFNDRVLVYQQKSLDITDQIVNALNKEYKKK
jgi:outer membrane protein